MFHSLKQAQSSCWFRSLYLINVHQALPYYSILHNWKPFALAALNSCEVLTKEIWRRGCKSPFVQALSACIRCSLQWVMSASVTRELHNILFFHVWEKTNENMYRSLDFSVFSSWLQVLREWVEVVTLLPVPTHFCSSFEVVLLLQCLMMVWVASIELHCQPTHHGECVIAVWLGKKK